MVRNGNFNRKFRHRRKNLSQYKLADMFTINPATAAKGLNLLADQGILYDKRGIGKFVTTDAQIIIRNKRINETLKELIEEIVLEAKYLQISEQELFDMVKTVNKEVRGNKE